MELTVKYNVEISIITAVDSVINRGSDSMDAVRKLFGRDSKTEDIDLFMTSTSNRLKYYMQFCGKKEIKQ